MNCVRVLGTQIQDLDGGGDSPGINCKAFDMSE